MNRLAAFLLALLALPAHTQTDGPYVTHGDGASEAAWVCDGAVKTATLAKGAALKAPCGEVGGFALEPRHAIAPDALPAARRWAAVSDIHGQAATFLALLRAHRIVDARHRWSFGKGVLVVVVDVFDRGDAQTESLWAIYRLAREARAAGGRVEMLLGNHEHMVMQGDLRYLNAKYAPVAALLAKPFPALYGPDTELGRWLRTRATVLKLGDTLFVHGGLHPDAAARWPDLAALNAKVRAMAGASREAIRADAEAAWLFGRDGPLWYRGYFMAPRASPADIDALLARHGAARIVVGHTTREEIISLYGGRVVGVDAGLKTGTRGEILLAEAGRLYRGRLDGTRVALAAGEDDGSQALEDTDRH